MSRRTGALMRAFVAWVPRGLLLALAGVVVPGAFGSKTFAAGKDYNTCFSESKVSTDRQVAACTAIAEDRGEVPDLRVSAYFVRGLAYAQRNDITHLIADMNEVIALDPTYVRAFTNRAIAWESKGDFDRAIADYTKAIMLTPDDASRYADRARALNKKGEHDRAIADCDKAIDIDPANEMAYGVRGVVWDDMGNAARAQADYDKAESVRNDPIAPYLDRVRSSIAERDRKRAKADCKHIANIDADKGRDCTRLIVEAFGEPSGGATDPNPASAQNAIGVEWQEKGDHTRAIAAFDEAIRLNPASSAFHFNRAKSWALKKDFARAIADLDEAVRRDPANAQAYRVRGMTMAQIGNSREAFADLDKAIAISSDDPESYFERALVWEAKDPDKAIADLDKAIALDPANAGYREKRLSVQISKSRANGQPVLQSPSAAPNQADVPVPAEPQPAKPTPPPTYEPPQLYAKQDNSDAIAWNLQSGLQAMQVDPNGAIDTFSFVIGLDPYNADAYYDRSIAEALVGNFDLAMGDCRRAVELDRKRAGTCWENLPGEQSKPTAKQPSRDPATAKTLLERAQMRLSKYGVDGALLDFDKAISLDPENADAYLGRSRARTLKGDHAGAAADCQRAVELDRKRTGSCGKQIAGDESGPASPPDVQQLQPSVAAAVATLAKQLGRGKAKPTGKLPASQTTEPAQATDPRVLSAVRSGETFWDAGKYDQAIEEYEKAIELDPRTASAYVGRGTSLIQKGMYDAAIDDFDKVIELYPTYSDAYIGRAVAWTNKNELDRAIADYSRVIELHPQYAPAYFARGTVWFTKGGCEPAIADFDQALKLDPKLAIVRKGRKLAIMARDEAKASKTSGKATGGAGETATRPSWTSLAAQTFNKGQALYGKDDYDGAIVLYGKAISFFPSFHDAYLARAMAWESKHDYAHAIADYSQAIALDPNNAETYHSRGQNRSFQGDDDGALADYEKAISLNPAHARVYADRGLIWMGRHEDAAAMRDFEKALSLDRNSSLAYLGRGVIRTSRADYDGAISDLNQAVKL
ncbi:tetratricopeptide repeat protein [Mesorhizobium argentiipisi]|uniref:Tetratricopeptide repeat protein n=1 Tax=Mesorhizobium argentiipisi TaxID=3015175 RepID=A0ABU8KLT7_9HYPH